METATAQDAPVSLVTAPAPDHDRHPIDGIVSCACCSRFPLVGERVTRHEGKRAGWVCAGCEAAGRGERLGPSGSTDRVRSLGGARNVRRAI
jgi:hypothetical protein